MAKKYFTDESLQTLVTEIKTYVDSNSSSTDGVVVNVEIGNWVAQSDGTYTNTITVSEVTANDIYDVNLYGDFSEEQAHAYDFLVSSIDTMNGKVVLTASEQITVAFSIILRGKVNLEDKNVYVSDLSATSIEYDNSKSGLDSTNMQNAMDEIATMVNGIVVNITADSWDLQDDGTYKKIVALEQITGNETLDVCLYPGDMHTQEQIVAFSELVTSIDTAEGMIILTAVEEITVSFRIFLYGKVNFDESNLVAVNGSLLEIEPISEEEFEKKSDAEKAAGNFLVDDGDEDEFLSARNIEFDGSEIGMEADNVHDAISEQNKKFSINNAGAHNCIYRGKYLGTSVTTAQYNAINAGTFDDLYIGDYWEINGVTWRIAAFDYYLNTGDTNCTTHHAVIVPDTCLYDYVMNDSATTAGAYVGSKMYISGLTQAKTTIKAAFSGHVLSHRIHVSNAVSNGKPSAAGWYDSEVDLMSEEMVYGTGIFRPATDSSSVPANYRTEVSQLPLFAHEPSRIYNRVTWWLRDVVTDAHFTAVSGDGLANYHASSDTRGVRPAFCIS